jgi:hypothetical protein
MKKLILILFLVVTCISGFSQQNQIQTDTIISNKYLESKGVAKISWLNGTVINTVNLNTSGNINTNTLYGTTLHTDKLYMGDGLTNYLTVKTDIIFDTTQVKMYVYSKNLFMPNLFWGKWAGNNTNTGLGGSIGLGSNVLSEQTTGYGNIAIGYQAGGNTTSGNSNVYIGKMTGLANLTGDYNVYVGSEAGVQDTSGKWNVFVGGGAGNANKNGINNTYLGTDAGLLALGHENTFIGSESGASILEGTGNIFIGYKSGSNETSVNNKLIISNKETSNLIEGDFSTGKVTINDVIKLIPRTSVPLNPVEGEIFVNSTDHHIYCYLNGMWRQLD